MKISKYSFEIVKNKKVIIAIIAIKKEKSLIIIHQLIELLI